MQESSASSCSICHRCPVLYRSSGTSGYLPSHDVCIYMDTGAIACGALTELVALGGIYRENERRFMIAHHMLLVPSEQMFSISI